MKHYKIQLSSSIRAQATLSAALTLAFRSINIAIDDSCPFSAAIISGVRPFYGKYIKIHTETLHRADLNLRKE